MISKSIMLISFFCCYVIIPPLADTIIGFTLTLIAYGGVVLWWSWIVYNHYKQAAKIKKSRDGGDANIGSQFVEGSLEHLQATGRYTQIMVYRYRDSLLTHQPAQERGVGNRIDDDYRRGFKNGVDSAMKPNKYWWN